MVIISRGISYIHTSIDLEIQQMVLNQLNFTDKNICNRNADTQLVYGIDEQMIELIEARFQTGSAQVNTNTRF
jgi:hypothetical protein